MRRIVCISPYRDLSILVQSESEALGIPIEFYTASMEEAAAVISGLKNPEVDVFISRGGTADFIASKSDIPVITVNTGPFDIMECCEEARQYSRNIAITTFAKPCVGIDLLERTMHITITSVLFHSLPELKRKIESLAETGDYCIVGGGPSVTYAADCGLRSVFLRTSPETVRDALIRADELARLRIAEKRKFYRLQTILDSVYDGIIAVDESSKIEIYNKSAERILGIDGNDVIGKSVNDIITTTRLDAVMKTGNSEIGDIQTIGDVRIVTSRVPVKDGNEIIGAVATFQNVSGIVQAERRVRKELTGSAFMAKFTFNDIIGKSVAIKEKINIAQRFSQSDLTVLMYGPTGTGKELFAQSIHNASKRARRPFVAVNCGALPPNLLESELFGYEEGAFTGAKRKGKHGLFELAHGGTIFLDEIDAFPIEMQGRLLRVLQEREVLRIGGESIIPVDIRVIAATNVCPRQLLSEHKIRNDLFYRLNVLYLELPALQDRNGDIPLLCSHFIPPNLRQLSMGVIDNLMEYMLAYSWPGNVRELYNVMQRLVFFLNDYSTTQDMESVLQVIAPNILEELKDENQEKSSDLRNHLIYAEKVRILKTVESSANIAEAAQKLGIGKSTLWRKLKNWKDNKE